MHSFSRWILTGLMVLGLSACPGNEPLPIDASKAALEINQDADGLAESIARAAGFVGATQTVMSVNEVCVTEVVEGGQTTTTCEPQPVDVGQPGRDAAKWLKDHLFNDGHVNAALTTKTAAVFCLAPADICEGSASCADAFTSVPVCVKVQSFEEGEYQLDLLVGANQEMNPATFSLKPGWLKLETRLADVRAAIVALSNAAGGTLPEGFPSRLEGRFAWELSRLADSVLSLKAGILDAVAIDAFPAGHPDHLEVRLAKAEELWSITFDADRKTVDAELDAQAIDLLLGADHLFGERADAPCRLDETCPPPTPPVTGNVLLHLDGMSFSGLFDAASTEESFAVEGIGLGDGTSRLQYQDGGSTADLVKVDLNASLGRKLDVTCVKRADGVQVKVSPGLALLVDHDFRALAAQLPDLQGAALKAVSSISLTGSAPSIFLPAGKDEVKVEAGTLELSATGMNGQADISLTVGPDQCLLENPVEPGADAHPFAGFVSGACLP